MTEKRVCPIDGVDMTGLPKKATTCGKESCRKEYVKLHQNPLIDTEYPHIFLRNNKTKPPTYYVRERGPTGRHKWFRTENLDEAIAKREEVEADQQRRGVLRKQTSGG